MKSLEDSKTLDREHYMALKWFFLPGWALMATAMAYLGVLNDSPTWQDNIWFFVNGAIIAIHTPATIYAAISFGGIVAKLKREAGYPMNSD